MSWWRHQMESFSASLALCAGNSPVPGEFPSQRPVTRSVDVFFDLCLNKRPSKQSWGWWSETPPHPLRRHSNVEKIHTLFIAVHNSYTESIHMNYYSPYTQHSTRIRFCSPLCHSHGLNNWTMIRFLLYWNRIHILQKDKVTHKWSFSSKIADAMHQ